MSTCQGELTAEQLQQLYLCSLLLGRKREQPIFTCKAHVFHIDPKTKRSWVAASGAAVNVSFFYDSTRSLYRIISVEGTKAVINSTITPNMTFTKTSQKFGQWSDVRANTVYGLGFASEGELNKFIEKFQEVKEATRMAAAKATANGSVSGPGAANAAQAASQGMVGAGSACASPLTTRSSVSPACISCVDQSEGGGPPPSLPPPPPPPSTQQPPTSQPPLIANPPPPTSQAPPPSIQQPPSSYCMYMGAPPPPSSTATLPVCSVGGGVGGVGGDATATLNSINSQLKSSLVAHQRSQSLSGLQPGTESPKHHKVAGQGSSGPGGPGSGPPPPTSQAGVVGVGGVLPGGGGGGGGGGPGGAGGFPPGSAEAQLKYENDRLKLALAQSSANAKKWEVELSTLKNNNSRLTSALQESTANVEEWKRQLHAYKEENQRLKTRLLEVEASKGNMDAASELRKELQVLRSRVETLDAEGRLKDEEIRRLRQLENGVGPGAAQGLAQENEILRGAVNKTQAQLETALSAHESQRRVLDTLNLQLADRVQELATISREMATALQA